VDPVYSNVLSSSRINVSKDEKVAYNIPMDAVDKNWNQLKKMEMGIRGPSKSLTVLSTYVFNIGLIWSIINLFVNFSIENLIIIVLFIGVLVLRYFGPAKKSWGVVSDTHRKPISSLPLKLVNTKFEKAGARTVVTDMFGRYNFLTPHGVYKVIVEKTKKEGVPIKVYQSHPIVVKKLNGSVGVDINLDTTKFNSLK